jgi:hypothetical protein
MVVKHLLVSDPSEKEMDIFTYPDFTAGFI